MINPKQLLYAETASQMIKHSVKPNENGKRLKKLGKQGLLWREVEADSITGSIETFQKVFVCIEDYRLLFSETLHPSTTENAFLSANIGKSCLGYLALTAQSQVFLKYEKTSSSYSSNSLQRYGFQVKENEEIKLTLFAEEESERSLWIEVINEAIAEVEHELSTKALIIPSFATQNYGPMPDSTSQTSTAVDFPHMEGYLRKTSSGKTLGIKSVKKRWFRLEGGELRYYEDEDVRPSKVRGVFELSAIEVLPPEMENSPFVQIQFPDGGRLMKLEAANGKIAHDWRDALNQTIFVLQQNRTIYNSEFKKARRFNVYDHITDEEKKSLKATVAKTFTSTSSPSSPLPSPPPPSSSSPSPARKSFFGSSPTPPAPPSTPMTPSSKNIRRAESNGFESPIKSYYKSPQLVEMLKSCLVQHFLLKDLLNFNPIIDKLQEKIAVPGEVVIWQGSIGDLFYIIEKGSCEVVKDGKRVAVMSEGKSFGEMALLNSAVRQATIRALRTCRFWCLHRKAFREIIAIQEKQKVEERLQFLKGIELFQKFNDGGLEKIADVMTMKSYQPNDKIIRQGEVGDRFYMIASGRVSVTQQSTFSSTVVELVKLGPNKYFGELALIEDSPRKASVTAITAVTCWTVDRKSFLSLFGSMKEALNESVGVRMLKNVKLLNALSEHQLISVARCLENKAFVEGEVIIRQGDVGDCFYMIASGEVSVQVNHVQVAVLEAGTFFGEMSLLSNEKRSATVIALKDTTCLLLSRTNFNEHLGPLDEVIKAESERRQQMLSITQSGRRRASTSDGLLNRLRTISGSWFQTSTSPTNGSPKRDSLLRSNSLFGMTASMFSLSTLDKIKKLGFGTFGTVYLVQHHDTSKYYAMKEIRKEHLFSTDQEKNLYSEKENLLLLLSSSSSSSNNGSIFFPELYSTFHDPKCVYFIEQYFPSGDLWKCLYSNNLGKTKVGGITVEQARFYAANVLGAIQYMHQHDIIHRDLKPENMMLDASGYLKIVDFGSSKLLPLSDKTRSMVGSPEYLPPEMILCKEYNRSADIWTFGVFIFELLTRMTPYQHNNLVMIYRNIIETEEVLVTQFQQFQGFDSTAKTLISNILQFNLNIRLGMLHNGLQDLWESPFFSGILLEQVERRQIPAPYIPPSQDDADQVDTLEYIDLLEDPDNIPKYTGFFDYSEF